MARRRQLKSILPDHLDVIEEGTEHSEEASVSSETARSPRRPLSATSRPLAKAAPNKEAFGGTARSNIPQLTAPEAPVHDQVSSTQTSSSTKENHEGITKLSLAEEEREEERHSLRKRSIDVDSIGVDADDNANNNNSNNSSSSHKSLNTRIASSHSISLTKDMSKEESNSEHTATEKTTDDERSSGTSDSRRKEMRNDMDSDAISVVSKPPQVQGDGLYHYDEDDDLTESRHSNHVRGEDDEVLTWRLDPLESLSDWTLKVTRLEDGRVQLYHVHKNILAVGKRKSDYFAAVFKKASYDGAAAFSITDVTLPEVAATVVPLMLDYLYAKDQPMVFTTENVMGLRHLAQVFGIKGLFKGSMEFIQKDLTLATVVEYYHDSKALRDEKIRSNAARHCARNILKVDPSHPLLPVVDPHFFALIMSAPMIDTDAKKRQVSILLAEYCQFHKSSLDDESFLLLTHEKMLPLIDGKAALTMLEMEADLVVATSIKSFTTLTSLQNRCIKELCGYWQEISAIEPERTSSVCRKLPSFVVAELLVQSLNAMKSPPPTTTTGTVDPSLGEKARPNVGRSDSGSDAGLKKGENAKHRKDSNASIEAIKAEHATALAKLTRDYETNLLKLRDVCLEKDQYITKYRQELKRFERLPNNHEGKLIQSGRLSQPAKMPEVGRHETEGYLLSTKLLGAKYALFYYKADES